MWGRNSAPTVADQERDNAVKKWQFLCLCNLFLVGCNSAETETEPPARIAKAPPIGEDSRKESKGTVGESTERLIGGLKFQIPAGWEEKTLSNNMILGEFTLPGEAGPGRLTLSTAGGGTSANMDRWRGQFQPGPNDPEPKESQIRGAGKEVTLLELQGMFNDTFGGGGPKPNWQLLGVAIPIDSDHNYFVKLTGPKETVSARRDEFIKFIESARFDN